MNSLCIQIAGNQGEITEKRSEDDGLYISNKIGSLRILLGPANLKVLSVVLERLEEVKNAANECIPVGQEDPGVALIVH